MNKNILIFHTAFIGDIVLSTAMIKKIKEKYKNCNITYVTTPAGKAILSNNPHLDNIIAYEKRGKDKGLKGMLKLSKTLRKVKFDVAYVPHRYLRSSLIVFLSKINRRIGYEISEGKLFLNEKKPYDKSLHEVDKLLSLVDLDSFNNKSLELFPSEEDSKYIEKKLNDNGIGNEKLIAIAIGSKWNTKRWPIEYFNKLISKLEELKGARIVLIGGRDELALDVEYGEKTINLINETSLLQLAALLKRADIVITNDSSPIHIASAFNPYILAIFGATVKELGFTPWSERSEVIENEGLYCRPCGLHGGNECPEKHFRCMLEIKPERVYNRVLELLGKEVE